MIASRMVLLGIVPTLMQIPPTIDLRSTMMTRLRSLAPWIAAWCPAGPEPITARSKSKSGIVIMVTPNFRRAEPKDATVRYATLPAKRRDAASQASNNLARWSDRQRSRQVRGDLQRRLAVVEGHPAYTNAYRTAIFVRTKAYILQKLNHCFTRDTRD